jgi:ankyrin repeat protein
MIAAAKGNIEMMNLILMNNSIDINAKIKDHNINSFWIACMCKQGKIMKILAEAGIDIYQSNKNGLNALHLAVITNELEIVKMLLKSNYCLLKTTKNHFTAL